MTQKKVRKYTREQLIKAELQYRKNYHANPTGFEDEIVVSEKAATVSIDYLLSLVPKSTVLEVHSTRQVSKSTFK